MEFSHRRSCMLALAAALLSTAAPMAAEFDRNTGLKAIGADAALEAGLTGKGIKVGVVDTGVSAVHPEFAGRYLGGMDFTTLQNPYIDPDGHGTHVAGIIAAARNGLGMHGVAPDAFVFSYRTIGARAFVGDEFAEIIDHAGKSDLHILNASFSIPALDVLSEDELAALGPRINSFDGLATNDVVMVFAAGNSGLDQASVMARLPAYAPKLQANWLAVVALGPTNDLASYSNRCGMAAQWCLAAPGGDQNASGLQSDGILSTSPNGGYAYAQGTSMATPHVSGALAIAKEAFPGASAQLLATLALHTSGDIGAAGVDDVYGWGRLDLSNIVRASQADHMAVHAYSGWSTGLALDGVVDVARSDHGSGNLLDEWRQGQSEDLNGPIVHPTTTLAWLSPVGVHGRIGSGGSEVTGNAAGLVGGVDLLSTPLFSAGAMLGVTTGGLDVGQDTSSTIGLHAGVYGEVDTGFLVGDVQAGYGWFETRTQRRNIAGLAGTVLQNAIEEATAREDAFWANVRVGSRFDAGVLAVTPYLRGGAVSQKQHAAAESSTALAVSLDEQDRLDTMAGIGIELEGQGTDLGAYVLTPSLDVSYVRHLEDTGYTRTGSVVGTSRSASTPDLGQDQIDLGAALSFASVSAPIEIDLGYDGSFRSNASSHSFSAGLSVKF